MVNVNIKVIHKEALRRFTLPSSASWIELEAKLRPLFSIPALSPFTLSYTDEDNDVITLSTDIELQEILSSSPTVKFNLKYSTPDDSSDSEDSGDEVWVLEGGNIPRKRASITKIETDTTGLQVNVSQNNIVSTTNQELQELQKPQFIEVDSRDINETSSNQKTSAVDDDLERDEKTRPQVNLLDDEFFDSLKNFNLSKPIHQTQIEDEQDNDKQGNDKQDNDTDTTDPTDTTDDDDDDDDDQDVQKQKETIEESSSSNIFTYSLLEQDQPQQPQEEPVVDFQQFLMMVEQNQDAIKENPQLIESIKDIMDQIQRLNSYREPKRHNIFIPPIPGSFPAIPVVWAGKPKDEGGRACRGRGGRGGRGGHRGHRSHKHHGDHDHHGYRGRHRHPRHHRHHYDNYYDNYEQGENPFADENTLETEESGETTDFQILYSEQIEKLSELGFRNQNELVELLIKHEGEVDRVIDELLSKC